ncbi:hypothetical protein [Streptomyces sp. NPDC056527]|uniref:hypothetical protein n=1 Tax=Streptomyces sp. NPDC056527 TaxID=3345853 RepID=UPI003699CB77
MDGAPGPAYASRSVAGADLVVDAREPLEVGGDLALLSGRHDGFDVGEVLVERRAADVAECCIHALTAAAALTPDHPHSHRP